MTPDQKARVNDVINKALGRTTAPRRAPTRRQIEAALGVLMWLSEESEGDGEIRDMIGAVRHELNERLEE